MRASKGGTSRASMSDGISLPVCGMETISGASSRCTCSHSAIFATDDALVQRIKAHAVDQFRGPLDVPDGEIAALARRQGADVVAAERAGGVARDARQIG